MFGQSLIDIVIGILGQSIGLLDIFDQWLFDLGLPHTHVGMMQRLMQFPFPYLLTRVNGHLVVESLIDSVHLSKDPDLGHFWKVQFEIEYR